MIGEACAANVIPMPTTPDTPAPRGPVRALAAALAAAPPHPAFFWLSPCGPWLLSTLRRRP